MSTEEFLESFGPGTKTVYKTGIKVFEEFYRSAGLGDSIDDFLDAVEEDMRKSRREKQHIDRKVLRDFVKWLEKHDYSPKTIKAYVSAVQSYANYYGIHISTRYIRIPEPIPISDKFPWTTDKVYEFVNLISNQTVRTIAVIIFQSGLSVSDVLNLTWGKIKDEFNRKIVPLCLDVYRSKTKVHFMTFIGKWGFNVLKEYLKGKRLLSDDKLFDISQRLINYHFQVATKKWIGEYRGFSPCRPHSLRVAFKTILSQAGAPYDIIEFFMGHKLPEHIRVYHSRTRDGWREIYAKYEPYLTPSQLSEKNKYQF